MAEAPVVAHSSGEHARVHRGTVARCKETEPDFPGAVRPQRNLDDGAGAIPEPLQGQAEREGFRAAAPLDPTPCRKGGLRCRLGQGAGVAGPDTKARLWVGALLQ